MEMQPQLAMKNAASSREEGEMSGRRIASATSTAVAAASGGAPYLMTGSYLSDLDSDNDDDDDDNNNNSRARKADDGGDLELSGCLACLSVWRDRVMNPRRHGIGLSWAGLDGVQYNPLH